MDYLPYMYLISFRKVSLSQKGKMDNQKARYPLIEKRVLIYYLHCLTLSMEITVEPRCLQLACLDISVKSSILSVPAKKMCLCFPLLKFYSICVIQGNIVDDLITAH